MEYPTRKKAADKKAIAAQQRIDVAKAYVESNCWEEFRVKIDLANIPKTLLFCYWTYYIYKDKGVWPFSIAGIAIVSLLSVPFILLTYYVIGLFPIMFLCIVFSIAMSSILMMFGWNALTSRWDNITRIVSMVENSQKLNRAYSNSSALSSVPSIATSCQSGISISLSASI